MNSGQNSGVWKQRGKPLFTSKVTQAWSCCKVGVTSVLFLNKR